MSSEQTFSTHDLRSTAQDYNRDAAHKHKWRLGANEVTGRGAANPRPFKESEVHRQYNLTRRTDRRALASAKGARKHDALEHDSHSSSDSNSGSDCDMTELNNPSDVGIMYSFDAVRGPTEGSQILNAKLVKAMEKFEEKETVKLVKNEYEVLDSEGESVGLSPAKNKGKGKAVEKAVLVDEDDEYELV